jgi:tRNA (guanine37-N1)-methyltransferase
MRRAREAGLISFSLYNPRDAATDAHRSVDDRPYGGGPGMVLSPGPLTRTLRTIGFGQHNGKRPGRLILLTPKGRPFTQEAACELAGLSPPQRNDPAGGMRPDPPLLPFPLPGAMAGAASASEPGALSGSAPGLVSGPASRNPCLTLVCGRYEGLDARIEELFPVEAVSVGDFVLNGGEAAALCLIEAVARLLPGFLGHEESGDDESFSAGLLEYPQYTRPEDFEGLPVPEVLRSGDHGRIARWRRQRALAETLDRRPDMLTDAPLDASDRDFLRGLDLERPGRNLYCALVHYPVLDKGENSLAVSLTNLDIHDIARSSCTYGLGGYYVLTPIEDQRELLRSILGHWLNGPGAKSNPDRAAALEMVRSGALVGDAIADISARTGQEPLLVGTTARVSPGLPPIMGFRKIAGALRSRPVLLLFGTGYGLSPEAHALCHAFAPPLRWHGGYNHLSVRSAAAVVFDRILGDWR